MNPLVGHRVLLEEPHGALSGVGEILERRGLLVRRVSTLEPGQHDAGVWDGAELIPWDQVDLIVGRVCRCFDGPLKLLVWLQGVPDAPPVVIVCDELDFHLYLEAMRRGAFDCVGLPLNERELVRIVTRALEIRHQQAVELTR